MQAVDRTRPRRHDPLGDRDRPAVHDRGGVDRVDALDEGQKFRDQRTAADGTDHTLTAVPHVRMPAVWPALIVDPRSAALGGVIDEHVPRGDDRSPARPVGVGLTVEDPDYSVILIGVGTAHVGHAVRPLHDVREPLPPPKRIVVDVGALDLLDVRREVAIVLGDDSSDTWVLKAHLE